MKVLSFFGACRHRPVSGYAGSAPYGALRYRGTDGMGVVHLAVEVNCRDCGKPFDVAMFHTTDAAFSTHIEQIHAIASVQSAAIAKATGSAA